MTAWIAIAIFLSGGCIASCAGSLPVLRVLTGAEDTTPPASRPHHNTPASLREHLALAPPTPPTSSPRPATRTTPTATIPTE